MISKNWELEIKVLGMVTIALIVLTFTLLAWSSANTDPSKKIKVESVSCGQYGTVRRFENPNTGKVFHLKLAWVVNCPPSE